MTQNCPYIKILLTRLKCNLYQSLPTNFFFEDTRFFHLVGCGMLSNSYGSYIGGSIDIDYILEV
jgi:hypothetical protein